MLLEDLELRADVEFFIEDSIVPQDLVLDDQTFFQESSDQIAESYNYLRVKKLVRIFGIGKNGVARSKADVQKMIDQNDRFFQDLEVIADDVFGGYFFIEKTGTTETRILYFAPDSLCLEVLELAPQEFIDWLLTDAVYDFYSVFDWDNREDWLKRTGFNEAISFYPFLWAKECDITAASKSVVPAEEVFSVNMTVKLSLD